jgi:hypothetical protein
LTSLNPHLSCAVVRFFESSVGWTSTYGQFDPVGKKALTAGKHADRLSHRGSFY